ncbi:hypothetical protein [Neisseria sp. Ec49-e6-T10]|uniref:hypothetical protein n=1 Tax=Neisseria sp. Ec49-e6-T10 TaxID=3140744 RepID=UPI003EBC6B60
MVRNDIYTNYAGKEYRIFRDRYDKYLLVSNDKSDIVKGFIKEDDEDEIYLKEIFLSEGLEVYSIDTYGIYKNYKFSLSEHGEQYVLWTSDCEIAEKLGFEMLGRGDYEKLVPKSDIEHIYEVKEVISDYFSG